MPSLNLMNNSRLKIIKSYFQKNFVFILLFIVILLLEIFGFNHRFFVNTFAQLQQEELQIQNGTLYGLVLVNDTLVSEHNDPNLTFRDLDKRVRYIRLRCQNLNEAAHSQIFYRRVDEDFVEENSILFSLHESEIMVSLPKTINVTSLRFDLTNKPNDVIVCQGITINPEASFQFSFFRFSLLLLSIIGLIFSEKILSPKISLAIWDALLSNGLWVFAFLIILIDTAYPVTIAFDSAHFLWLADHIRTGNWSSWDPIRNIGYPLQLYISNTIFGNRQEALLIPMIVSHVLLFIFSSQIALILLRPLKKNARFLLYLALFLLIGLDPTIVGYFHVLLTEYLAATIAVISCFMALKLYEASVPSKRFYLLSFYFLVFVPISWHLKQPYIGAAYFPLFLVSLLTILRKFSAKNIFHLAIVNLVILAVVFASTLAWNNFLDTQDNPMDEERVFTSYAETRVENRIDKFRVDPVDMVKVHIYQYLVSTNFIERNVLDEWKEPSLTRGFQNWMIAQRMFLNPGSSSKLYEYPLYDPYTRAYHSFSTPPNWLNSIFQSRVKLSNFLFTTSYLLLPVVFLIFIYLWIRKKNLYHSGLIILSGTSLLNAIAHLLGSPIDRYLFMGYPLNLLLIVICTANGVRIINDKLAPKLSDLKAKVTNRVE